MHVSQYEALVDSLSVIKNQSVQSIELTLTDQLRDRFFFLNIFVQMSEKMKLWGQLAVKMVKEQATKAWSLIIGTFWNSIKWDPCKLCLIGSIDRHTGHQNGVGLQSVHDREG